MAKRDGGFSAPEFSPRGWRKSISRLLGANSTGDRVRRAAYLNEWQRLVEGHEAAACDACRGVREFLRLAKAAGVPIFVVYLAKGFPDPGKNYAEGRPPREQLLGCLAEAGLSPYLASVEGENFFWEGDFHLNPEGLASLAGSLSAQLKEREGSRCAKNHSLKRRACLRHYFDFTCAAFLLHSQSALPLFTFFGLPGRLPSGLANLGVGIAVLLFPGTQVLACFRGTDLGCRDTFPGIAGWVPISRLYQLRFCSWPYSAKKAKREGHCWTLYYGACSSAHYIA